MDKRETRTRRQSELRLRVAEGITSFGFYMHDSADAFRFELSGNLAGAATEGVAQAWATASSTFDSRPVIIDVSAVTEADESGRKLLGEWHRSGARILARSAFSRKIVESIGGTAAADEAKPGWRQRVRALLRRPAGAAVIFGICPDVTRRHQPGKFPS
jgi:hypothetical protein